MPKAATRRKETPDEYADSRHYNRNLERGLLTFTRRDAGERRGEAHEDALALEIAAMKIEEKALGEQFMILTGLEKVPGSLEASRAVRRSGCPGADPAPACGAEGGDHQGARTGQRGCA